MRRLMWFTIGLAAVCCSCAYTLPYPPLAILATVAVAGLALSWMLSRRCAFLRCATVACGGALVGLWLMFAFQMLYLNPLIPYDGTTQQLTLTASDYSQQVDTRGMKVDAVTQLAGKPVKVRIYLEEDQPVSPGDQLQGAFQLRLTAPGGEEESYHAASGLFFLAFQDGELLRTPGDSHAFRYFPVRLREGIKNLLQAAFPADAYPFAAALLLGDTQQITYQQNTAFRISGIAHLIAVSGMHVAVLYALLQLLALRRRFLTALLTIPALVLFTAVAGFTPSVTRASLMVGLMVVGQALNREYDAPTALSFSVLVMVCINPLVVTSVSLQLSVGCVAGIILFSQRIQDWLCARFRGLRRSRRLHRFLTGLSASIAVSLSATILITPLCAIYFGNVSMISLLTNLVTLWAANLLFYGIIVTIPIALLWPWLGGVLGWVLAWLARFVEGAAGILSRIPLAAVYTRSPYIIGWIVFVYLLLAFFLLQRRKHPAALGCLAAIGLCVALLASWIIPRLPDTRLTVLDVGQGQSIILQSHGRTVLIDCGGDNDEQTADLVANTLLSQGIRRLDAIILTHGDRDHAGGVLLLMSRIPAEHLLYPCTLSREQSEALSAGNAGSMRAVTEDLSFSMGSGKLTVFAPPLLPEDNENSLCVLYESDGCSILITGDRSDYGERLLLWNHTLPDVDILIAGHHGSKHSTSQALLDAVKPETVIISVSRDNAYGHPAQELLERVVAAGCQVLRTDLQGDIVITR